MSLGQVRNGFGTGSKQIQDDPGRGQNDSGSGQSRHKFGTSCRDDTDSTDTTSINVEIAQHFQLVSTMVLKNMFEYFDTISNYRCLTSITVDSCIK